jgi:peroxiredoxin
MFRRLTLCLLFVSVSLSFAQKQETIWSEPERPILQRIRTLRQVPDEKRAAATREIAGLIRQLPASANKVNLASGLASLSTEGDFGRDTLQGVASMLADALREQAASPKGPIEEAPWVEMAQLIRYEHVKVPLDGPLLNTAMARLQAEDQQREKADFTLTDLQGKSWTLKQLHGKVVLVNFWATWCAPCRKEMPDLDTLYKRFQSQGLVILAISDEQDAKVRPFIAEKKVLYPILLDPGSKVNKLFAIDGIPKSLLYDREGKLVAQSIDMRTRGQFLEMLGRAGLK